MNLFQKRAALLKLAQIKAATRHVLRCRLIKRADSASGSPAPSKKTDTTIDLTSFPFMNQPLDEAALSNTVSNAITQMNQPPAPTPKKWSKAQGQKAIENLALSTGFPRVSALPGMPTGKFNRDKTPKTVPYPKNFITLTRPGELTVEDPEFGSVGPLNEKGEAVLPDYGIPTQSLMTNFSGVPNETDSRLVYAPKLYDEEPVAPINWGPLYRNFSVKPPILDEMPRNMLGVPTLDPGAQRANIATHAFLTSGVPERSEDFRTDPSITVGRMRPSDTADEDAARRTLQASNRLMSQLDDFIPDNDPRLVAAVQQALEDDTAALRKRYEKSIPERGWGDWLYNGLNQAANVYGGGLNYWDVPYTPPKSIQVDQAIAKQQKPSRQRVIIEQARAAAREAIKRQRAEAQAEQAEAAATAARLRPLSNGSLSLPPTNVPFNMKRR